MAMMNWKVTGSIEAGRMPVERSDFQPVRAP
jgi:hypothetical protein